ncbi:hypothetical protein BGX34_009850 [Mortierella sp. NVP85]|nr:hypothetical protein BGX34_009850 [Mortierella sp. NVP85]
MATPQPQKDQPTSASSTSTPSSPVPKVDLNFENSAFFSEPTFEKRPPSPVPGAAEPASAPAKVDAPSAAPATIPATAPAASPSVPVPEPAAATPGAAPSAPSDAKQEPAASTAVKVEAAATPAQTSATPTSPTSSVPPPAVSMVVNTSITEEVDQDVDMIEDKDGPASSASPVDPNSAGLPRENGVQPSEQDRNKSQLNRVEELQILNASLQANLEDMAMDKQSLDSELNRTRAAYHELHRQYMELNQKLDKRERDYEVMSRNYLEHVRLIRATDDDHGTMMDRLTQLKASIEHLIRKAQGARSVNLNRDAAVEHFKNSGLLKDFPIPEDKLESYHLNLYMESVVMSTLVSNFFEKPLSCAFDYNGGFKDIYDWMLARNDRLAVRWRQQLCKMLADDPATKARKEEEVTKVAVELSELVSKVYANANELNKIKDICTKSFELAIAATGLESVISPVTVPLGTPYDEETMGTSLKSNPEGKVALVIFPGFKDKESAFDVRPKVWCY